MIAMTTVAVVGMVVVALMGLTVLVMMVGVLVVLMVVVGVVAGLIVCGWVLVAHAGFSFVCLLRVALEREARVPPENVASLGAHRWCR